MRDNYDDPYLVNDDGEVEFDDRDLPCEFTPHCDEDFPEKDWDELDEEDDEGFRE